MASRVMHTYENSVLNFFFAFGCILDNSDLHLKIAADGLSGKPLEDEGFSYLLAGARATWGVTTGKVCFECKVKVWTKSPGGRSG